MQVGDWVEFQVVVVKRRHASGSAPATQTLARKRRGMLIGERHVYHATTDVPPTLSHPQRVLLVAVSLHRCYKVFPSDVRPSTASRRRQARAVQAVGASAGAVSAQTLAGGV